MVTICLFDVRGRPWPRRIDIAKDADIFFCRPQKSRHVPAEELGTRDRKFVSGAVVDVVLFAWDVRCVADVVAGRLSVRGISEVATVQ